MAKRKSPKAPVTLKAGVSGGIAVSASQRWNPDVKASEAAADERATISILDPIGADMWGDGVTAKRIGGALRSIGPADVVVNINSPGGDYFEGLAIYNQLREHPGKVTVRVLGMAASAASVIAMAADEIQIGRAAFLMIHNTWVVAQGDRNAFRDVADWLEPFDEAATDIYAARSGKDRAEIRTMLDRETWLSGQASIDQGFADALLPSDLEPHTASPENMAMTALAAAKKIDLMLAGTLPRSQRRDLVAALKTGTQDAAPHGTQDAANLDLESLSGDLKSAIDKLKFD